MRIEQKPVLATDWSEHVVCKTCSARLEISADDVKHRKATVYCYDFDWKEDQFYVNCPICKYNVIIVDSPWSVREAAKRAVPFKPKRITWQEWVSIFGWILFLLSLIYVPGVRVIKSLLKAVMPF